MKNFKKIAATFVAIVIAGTAINTKAATTANLFSSEEPFTVRYIGNEGEYLLFQIIVKSDNTKNTSFEISDKAEGEIYAASINSTYKEQTLKIEKRDNQELDFKLVIGKNVYSRSFAILSTVEMEKK